MIARWKTKDCASGVLFSLVGGIGLLWSFSYSIGSARQMGPGYFPAAVFGMLLLFGLVIALKAFWDSAGSDALEAWRLRPLVVILGSLFFFACAIQWLGFVVACMALILVSTMAGTQMTIVQRMLLAVGLTAFNWLVFIQGLGMLIPVWPEFR